MKFSKEDTFLMKGFAIIFLCCYHCFSSYSRLSGVNVSFFPFSQKMGMYISESLNLCVGMFAFLSVFGMTLTLKNNQVNLEITVDEKIKFVLKRYMGLIAGFLIPFFFCQIVSAIKGYNPYGKGIVNPFCNFLLDMLGISKLFGTPMMTGTWWYMSLAVLLIIFFPLSIDIYRKYKTLTIPMWAIFLLLNVEKINNLYRWLFIIPLGICFADLDWFSKLYRWMRKNEMTLWLKRIGIYAIFICIVYLRRCPWGLRYIGLLVNSITPIFMIFILYDLLYKASKIKTLFCFLGHHSANIFYIHTFIREIWFNELTYSFHHAGLILVFLLTVTLLISMAIEVLKSLIGWNEKVYKVKKGIIDIISINERQ